MHVFRISSKKYIRDLSGKGAELNGGRWNSVGVPVLYTGSNPSVCVLEYLAHLKNAEPKKNHYGKAVIEVPDGSVKEVNIVDLPDDWQLDSASATLSKITNDWIAENLYLCLKVPSVASPGDWNYLINPKHKLFKKVKRIGRPIDYSFDERIHRKFEKKTLEELLNEAQAELARLRKSPTKEHKTP
ncbi:RES family NAD+ phosphorylase [Fibrella aquatica]|uniref:RES family NAD+ phosphorylase n=1 Tax=Fibrella aquatica TaxID=3242487 RepID=UPI0035218F31